MYFNINSILAAFTLITGFSIQSPPLPLVSYTDSHPVLNQQMQNLNTDTSERNWYFKSKNDGTPPEEPEEVKSLLNKYNSYYQGSIDKKELYLTFDEGYENGQTEKILDILKKNNVPAAFFVVKPYIAGNPDIIKRMVSEGHLVCNHSATHPSMAQIRDKSAFEKELTDVESAYKSVTNSDMPRFFRPPMGKYSELSLALTDQLGYKTIFWSAAYEDWNINKQPSEKFAYDKIINRTHNGAIILLHAVSKTNTAILQDLITKWKNDGYKLKSLNDLK